MTKEIWFNLPVKDLHRSKTFFENIGFTLSENGNGNVSAGFKIGSKNVVMMLFEESTFKQISGNNISDTKSGSEILISLDAESRQGVDELAGKVIKNGGTIFAPPADSQGWMYGFGFQDLDGHRWNVLYMDLSKLN